MGDADADIKLIAQALRNGILKIKPDGAHYIRTPYAAERKPTDFPSAPFSTTTPQRDIASERQATITRLQEQAYDLEVAGKVANAADLRRTIANVRQMDDAAFVAWMEGR